MLQDLQKLISQVNNALILSANQNVAPKYRFSIYEALRAINPNAINYLVINTVEFVLPLWNGSKPSQDFPQVTLNVDKDAVKGLVPQYLLENMVQQLWPIVEKLGDDDSGLSNEAYFVLHATYQALAEISGIRPFEDEDAENAEDEDDIDVWSADTARFASYAYAGRIGFPESNSTKRQKFWKWWLNEAIPQALELAQDDKS